MPKNHLSYSQTGYFSTLMCDYLAQEESTTPFYHRFPTLENFKAQVKEKQLSFRPEGRNLLVQQLKKQYECCNPSEATLHNIEALQIIYTNEHPKVKKMFKTKENLDNRLTEILDENIARSPDTNCTRGCEPWAILAIAPLGSP